MMASTSPANAAQENPQARRRRDARTHLLDVAESLFLSDGIRATGVDTVTAQAQVAKTTLYRHFPSKDELISAYLQRRDDIHFTWLRQAIERHPTDHAAQLHAIVDLIAAAVTTPGFGGCPFLNAASEFADPHHPARTGSAAHKTRVVTLFTDLARRAGARDPDGLAQSLALLTDGAYEAGRLLGAHGPATRYAPTAHELITRATS